MSQRTISAYAMYYSKLDQEVNVFIKVVAVAYGNGGFSMLVFNAGRNYLWSW